MAPTALQHSPATPGVRHDAAPSLEEVIKRAAHVLPSQGPISVFVHHNTLHAFEAMPFDEAVKHGLDVYGQQPYLSEQRYRLELSRGRIRQDDLVAVLQHDLGDDADVLIGLLGTRFHVRLAMMSHALHTASSAELSWVIAETDAARQLRADMPPEKRQLIIQNTRRWIMRELGSRGDQQTKAPDSTALQAVLDELFENFEKSSIEEWDDRTWEAFALQLLWKLCLNGVSSVPLTEAAPSSGRRHRDLLLAAVGEDADELVHDVLIRFTAAHLDQGFAHWTLPHRSGGFYRAFVSLYGSAGKVAPRWLHGLRAEASRLAAEKVKPLRSIEHSLELLGVERHEWEPFITSTLLALRGWAGMIWQLETNADWAVRPACPGTLAEFLAVRLLLERFAIADIARRRMNHRGPLREVREAASRLSCRVETGHAQLAFVLFQLAQVLGVTPEDLHALPAKTWTKLIAEVEEFSEIERRRIFQQAYERRYREDVLAALAAHADRKCSHRPADGASPSFQIICCIDEREESFRRHLEEIEPRCETFGYAGFFGVAMYYRGADDAHARPLCPVVIKPRHYVEELPVLSLEQAHARRAGVRRLLGTASHHFHRGSRSLVGGMVTAICGSLASIPLVARILFPRAAAQLRRLFAHFVRTPEITQLLLERTELPPGPEDGHVGYTVPEMADIVERTLRDNGLISGFAPLVIMCGHGSSSLNNPHESAYNCGACSGGRGGPNARAFAQMANDPRVRTMLATRGLNLPHATYFVGAYHNTCNDAVAYFDLDRLPVSHKTAFAATRLAIDEARQRNAHERCRRFESASLAITPKAALAHVEGRSEDLSQARPEYNHATNAVTFVGRRATTRGLYLDRRCFLASYDSGQDDDQGTILARILGAVIPVCAGISLEYYFSCVDPQGYGCGSKLPHNIVSLLGVMEGALSDLRPGLSAQMVEIHEPMRQLFIVETSPDVMQRIIDSNAVIRQLCDNQWVQLVTLDPQESRMHIYLNGEWQAYRPPVMTLPQSRSSAAWYQGWRDNLGFAEITATAEMRDAR